GQRTWEWGVTGPDALEEHLLTPAPALPEMPGAVADLLRRCFREDPEQRPRSLPDAAAALREAYEAATGRPSPRREPRLRQHRPLGRLHLALGDPGRALSPLDEAARRGLASPDLDRDLGLALVSPSSAGDPQRALASFGRLLQAGSPEALDVVGYVLALQRLGQEAKARRFYEQAAQENPDLPPEIASAIAAFLPGHAPGASL